MLVASIGQVSPSVIAFVRLCRGDVALPDSQCALRVRGVPGALTPGTSPRPFLLLLVDSD